MTVDLDTPAGALESKFEPIVFTAERSIVCISAEFNPDDGTWPRETIYDGTDAANENGSFSFLYRLSERAGNVWTIVRENGWPAPYKLAIKESAAAAAAMQPTLYGPLAQWALQDASTPARLYYDRSGNGNHLTGGTATAAPDLIAGQTAVTAANLIATIPALALNGAMTLTCRVKRAGSGHQALLDIGTFGPTSNIYLGIRAPHPIYSPASGIEYEPASLTVPTDAWCFLSLRRTADGIVTLGINDAYASTDTMPVPTGTEGRVILGTVEGGSSSWAGAFADVSIWDKHLSDEELAVLYRASMGLS